MSKAKDFFEAKTYKDKVFKGLEPSFYPKKYRNYISEEVTLLKDKVKGKNKILEAGVGIGRLIPELAPIVDEFVGIDIAKFMVNRSKKISKKFKNVRIFEQNIEDLPINYPKNYFDYSLCVWNTLGNVEDPVLTLKAISHVTKDSIFVTVFNKGTIKDRLDFYKHVDVQVLGIEPETETFKLAGYFSGTFDKSDLMQLADKSGLIVADFKILSDVIIWAEFKNKLL